MVVVFVVYHYDNTNRQFFQCTVLIKLTKLFSNFYILLTKIKIFLEKIGIQGNFLENHLVLTELRHDDIINKYSSLNL